MSTKHLIIILSFPLLLTSCGQPGASTDGQSGGLGSAISGIFGQSEEEKALHAEQAAQIEAYKDREKKDAEARAEAYRQSTGSGQ
ncbi:MAG: hypothetical protein KC897_09110 [Candidatus Omnitrophica bacterium]|nr:hypothetical protein [Candidatus Omnitrophota bacterium]MCB9722274.1 hypothetical protein [Candidatus Omnitrophota bacterium]